MVVKENRRLTNTNGRGQMDGVVNIAALRNLMRDDGRKLTCAQNFCPPLRLAPRTGAPGSRIVQSFRFWALSFVSRCFDLLALGRCLRRVPSPGGPGLIASSERARVSYCPEMGNSVFRRFKARKCLQTVLQTFGQAVIRQTGCNAQQMTSQMAINSINVYFSQS